MTKSTITREQLIEKLKHRIAVTEKYPHLEEAQIDSQIFKIALAAMGSESESFPLDYLQGHKDGLEWAAQLAEANHPETGDWLYDHPIDLAKAIRKGPDMPPVQQVADSESVAEITEDLGRLFVKIHFPTTLKAGDKLYRHAQQPVVRPAPECQHQWRHGGANKLQNQKQCIKCGRVELDAQPAPVVPEEMTPQQASRSYGGEVRGYRDGWNACRAAMLQAQSDDDGEPTDDERIMAIEGIIPPISAGSSPLIPEGYVMVPKEMTDEIGEAIAMQANCCGGIALDIYDAMLAAAPQEVNRG